MIQYDLTDFNVTKNISTRWFWWENKGEIFIFIQQNLAHTINELSNTKIKENKNSLKHKNNIVIIFKGKSKEDPKKCGFSYNTSFQTTFQLSSSSS